MAVIPNPSKADRRNRTCTTFRIIIYNATTKDRATETFHGTREDAEKYERAQLEKLGRGTFVAKAERPTLAKLCAEFIKDQTVRGNAAATIEGYATVFNKHLIPRFGEWQVCTITRKHFREFCADLLKAPDVTAHTVDRITRHASILFNFAIGEEAIERSPLTKYRKPAKAKASTRVHRGAYSEAEMQAIIEASTARERAMIGVLCFTGIRPGELYALRWCDLNIPEKRARIARSWDHRGKQFVPPKTRAGVRTISLSSWLIEQLETYRAARGETLDSEGLVFPSRKGTPLNPSNVRRDVWLPLIERAGVKRLDMYSLRHTFATFARASGAESFNVARHIGHAKSVIVDTIYAETLDSGLAGMSNLVTERALSVPGTTPTPPSPPSDPVTPACNAVTPPLHKITVCVTQTCANDYFFSVSESTAANDVRINRAIPVIPGANAGASHPSGLVK